MVVAVYCPNVFTKKTYISKLCFLSDFKNFTLQVRSLIEVFVG